MENIVRVECQKMTKEESEWFTLEAKKEGRTRANFIKKILIDYKDAKSRNIGVQPNS